jgi:hypothetical protein
MRAWLVVAPAIAAGVLIAHVVAYTVTRAPSGPSHEYLAHAPQVLAVFAVVGLALGGIGARLGTPRTALFPVATIGTFVAQEHLERLVHDGAVPLLVTSPAFLVGLALQLPVALFVWIVARWVLRALAERPRVPLTFAPIAVELVAPAGVAVWRAAVGSVPARGPPSLLDC